MNTLHVEIAQTETTPGEFVTDGFRVVPVVEGQRQEPVYQSRFANKAMTKAFVLLGSDAYKGYAVTVQGTEVTDAAGKLNLSQRLDADRFRMIRELAMQDINTDAAVAMIKQVEAGHAGGAETEGGF